MLEDDSLCECGTEAVGRRRRTVEKEGGLRKRGVEFSLSLATDGLSCYVAKFMRMETTPNGGGGRQVLTRWSKYSERAERLRQGTRGKLWQETPGKRVTGTRQRRSRGNAEFGPRQEKQVICMVHPTNLMS